MANTVTEERITGLIKSEEFFMLGEKTIACLVILQNGFEIVGTSACVDPANFNTTMGREFAHEDAMRQIETLEGYRLQWELHEYREKQQKAKELRI